jgi:hypothetical protein
VPNSLESPGRSGSDWGGLYRARGEEVSPHRPYFTGDVFEKVPVVSVEGTSRSRTVIIIQHPCAMRLDGVTLVRQLLVAEVRNHPVVPDGDWTGFGKMMPLPDLVPTVTSGRRNQAAMFDELHLVRPAELIRRIACLSQLGVNLLLQRWVHHNSRVVVPTGTFNEQVSGVYEEADITEDWCDDRVSDEVTLDQASRECLKWLRTDLGEGMTRQRQLEDPQFRSAIRKQARDETRKLNGS